MQLNKPLDFLAVSDHAFYLGMMRELARLTDEAREAEITGVPTFQLGGWPLGGIQSDETMRAILARWAARQSRSH